MEMQRGRRESNNEKFISIAAAREKHSFFGEGNTEKCGVERKNFLFFDDLILPAFVLYYFSI
jgi:hypothetical protein